MLFAGTREHLARHASTWSCVGSALFGLAIGIVSSILFLDEFEAETPAYVQRSALLTNGEELIPRASQLRIVGLPEGEVFMELETEEASEDAAPVDVTGADDPQVAPAVEEAPPLLLSEGRRVLGVSFDLAAADSPDDLQVTKTVRLNGQALGDVNLSIDRQSRLHVSSEDLGHLLPDNILARFDTDGGYIGFDELRAGGLDIRYDPLDDVIEIKS